MTLLINFLNAHLDQLISYHGYGLVMLALALSGLVLALTVRTVINHR